MYIKNMFRDDIDRKINGVVQVEQDTADVIKQEVEEYVITRDLKKHFITFFKNYSESFEKPVYETGVWISGFFGSGKSHFLKMLSYILENKEIYGKTTVDRFENKFEDNREIFELMKSCTQNDTDTILFNIDIVGSKNKNSTAVLQVFAKMFYNHCGYFGENLKVALMEQYIDGEGKYEDFKAAFEKYKGKSWEEQRRAFAFVGKEVRAALVETLGISEEDAQMWYANKKDENYSIETLVKDIKAYVDKKPEGYRLMFMADEVGQYVGGDTSLLLNLQSLVEAIGSQCQGKVWIICTGQEAIDEIIKARENEFSRIQARFNTRLSLTSSSVDEVIQERILKKKPECEEQLKEVYVSNEAVMRNLFSFTDSVLDIKGFGSANDFLKNFPFIPYQFIVMQKVFTEIRKHGNSGKHMSGGERSMLSGFQEAAQKVKDRNEFSIAPFYLFYDTVHTFLDSSIRSVIDRALKAADNGNGLETYDVELLKLLYLIRYVDDIPSNIDNLIILMADDIRLDKIVMRETVRASLDRLIKQNYVARTGDTYHFLTDEEQDVARDINNTVVDTANVISQIGKYIFMDIYSNKKFRYDKYDFPFDQYIDQTAIANGTGGVTLQVLSAATYGADRNEMKLVLDSKEKAIIVLAETSYFETLENAMKIRKYVKQLNNFNQRPKSFQDIVRNQTEEAGKYEKETKELIEKAISGATCYVDGENIGVIPGDARNTIDTVLGKLIERVYSDLNLVEKGADSDSDIVDVLTGKTQIMEGLEPNQGAISKVSEYLTMQHRQSLTTSMADIQSRYQSVPYGWREIDIAYVVAQMIVKQKIDVNYLGENIQATDKRLVDMLRKKSEIGKVTLTFHVPISDQKLRNVKEILSDLFDEMNVPSDEKGLIEYALNKFEGLKNKYDSMLQSYDDKHNYPDYEVLKDGIAVYEGVLSKRKDSMALVDEILKRENDLFDTKDSLANLDSFFSTQVNLFDQAVRFLNEISNDLDYYSSIPETDAQINQIREIVTVPTSCKYDYKKIPQLNGLISSVKESRENLLEEKRKDLLESLKNYRDEVHQKNDESAAVLEVIENTDSLFDAKINDITGCKGLTLLDGISSKLWNIRDTAITTIEGLNNPSPVEPGPVSRPTKNIKSYQKQSVFAATSISNADDVDAYVESVRQKLLDLLDGCDEIRIS